MKPSAIFLIPFLFGCPVAPGQEVLKQAIRSQEPMTVQVSDRHTTTIIFPKPVTAIIGNELTDGKDGNDSALYQYSHPPNSRLVAFLARSSNASAPAVIVMDDELHLLKLEYSKDPNLAVTFTPPMPPKPSRPTSRRPAVVKAVQRKPLDVSPPNLMRLMELANSHRLPTSKLRTRTVNIATRLEKVTTVVEKAVWFKEDGAIAFTGRIYNDSIWTGREFNPSRLYIDIGGRRYPLAVLRVPAYIPRNGSVPFSAVLMGDQVRRNDLSFEGVFRLIVLD